ncbi:sulfatase-like hydrolase/transferase [Synoicihabitans lomoniglobus]|uniref:Sulfatase-like hydrolase/transferase n=1 Tax=Synoicihabitans lomoniglobus TaxID=2909285 RepID=A0AAF0CQ33_9BACT|nr:sulfatase-like hydrolase/transferase [Opitutaceae bacterium LMO-M01]WED65962.1 sulfatase-like hydrolase/transferase [Opitutaceae bacterium LMO-M01]
MPRSKRPNVIVFFTDQQRHDTTGVHGCPLGLTPNFDALARRGTHLVNSFTCQPVCGPARSCLQTGLYATQTGVWRNGLTPHTHLRTLAHHFNAAGYATGYMGKWHLAEDQHLGPVPTDRQGGYQTFLGANQLELVSDAYDTRLWDQDGVEHRPPGYRVDALTDAAIRYVDTPREQPFFMFLSFLEPHHQNHRDDYPAPDGYAERYTGRWLPPDLASLGGTAPRHWGGYCGMVKRLDEALGRLIDALKSTGQLHNTVILFTSDHGNHFKTRNSEYKRSCHDASIRVPTAICGPGFDGGGTVHQLVSLVDLPPTLLNAAGIAVPDEMEGHSLLDRDTTWPREVLVQISESQTGRCVRTARWKYSVSTAGSAESAATYTDDCLYDLEADPWELDNLIGRTAYGSVVAELRERLVTRMISIGETVPTIVDAPARPSAQRRIHFSDEDI